MSSMLEQAIVDAKALREAAVKSAESELLEKYADEMKQAVTSLLEAEADMGGMSPQEATPAYADGENLCPCPDEEQEIEVDFSDLRAQAEEEADAGEEESLGADLGGLGDDEGGLGGLGDEEEGDLGLGGEEEEDEELTLQEKEILQNLTNLFSEDVVLDVMKEEEDEEEKAEDKDEEPEDKADGVDVDALKSGFQKKEESLMKTIYELSERLKKQENTNKKYAGVIEKMTGRLAEVNLSNAKLLYTNRVLNNTSLNERQKNKIVESIGKAGSVNEAKTIFETLQNAVVGQSQTKRQPNSLSEAVRRNSSPYAIRGNGNEPQKTDVFSERMRRLAGITK